jgi:toxin-antitoxin system PIN domain toxin
VTPDVNVLVAAFRPGHQHHAAAIAWLETARRACAEGAASLTLLPMVVVGFLRLVTNPRVFEHPDAIESAIAFADVILGSPGVELQPVGAEWPMLREKVLALGARGNAIADGWIAAAAQAHGEHLVTFDRGFRRLLPARDLTLLEPVS